MVRVMLDEGGLKDQVSVDVEGTGFTDLIGFSALFFNRTQKEEPIAMAGADLLVKDSWFEGNVENNSEVLFFSIIIIFVIYYLLLFYYYYHFFSFFLPIPLLIPSPFRPSSTLTSR